MGTRTSAQASRREYSTPVPDDGQVMVPPETAEYRFTAHFPSRLHPLHVETIRVTLSPLQPLDRHLDISRKKTHDPLPLRLLVPGAVVTPTEHAVEASPFGPVEVVFHVAALADGGLSGSRLEVLRQGQVETIPLPIRSESAVPIRWLLALAVVLPIVLYLPACWPELAANGSIERGIREWLPHLPGLSATVAHFAQALYDFLAGPGKDVKISFFAFLGLAVAAAVWAFVCRPLTVSASGPTFRHAVKPKSGDIPPLLSPASAEDVKAIHGQM